MNKIIFFTLLFLISYSLFSQENKVTGTVSNVFNEYLMGAHILLYSKKDTTKIIKYHITNDRGEFSIKTDNLSQKYLTISYLGYKKKKTILSENIKSYKIILEESDNSLEEVTVLAKKIRDTVYLRKDTIKFSKNTKLKDLLKDNEGIEVGEENSLSFMGVPINKILINKKEVFVDQNSLALENITNEMVDNMQVINNYKDNFNVGFDNFNEMVLNINVKSKFKGVLKNIIELGLGIENAYFLKGNSFFFSDKVNIFLTQNTNSILDKTKNKSEITNRQGESSSFYKDNVYSISQGLRQVKDGFYNNTYLLVKKENKKSKLKTNLGYRSSNQEIDKQIIISDSQNSLSEESVFNKRKGNMFYTDFGLINLISNNFSINIDSNIDFVKNESVWKNTKNIFLPSTSAFNGKTDITSDNFIVKNTVSSKKLINRKWLWQNAINYTYENTENDYIFNSSSSFINQSIGYKNNQFGFLSSLFYQKSNLFNYGIKIDFTNKNENLDSKTSKKNTLKRDYKLIKASLILKGKNPKWSYFVNIGTQLYSFKNYNFKEIKVPVSASFNYKFSSRKTINISYIRNYKIENLENSLDSLYINSSSLILSNDILKNIKKSQNLVLDYGMVNIAKSRSIHFLAVGSVYNNFSQTNLINFNSDINTYQRKVFDKRKSVFLRHSFSKGFYFSKDEHNIRFGYKISGLFSESKTIQNDVLLPLYTELFDFGLIATLTPQNTFFTELELRTNYSKNNLFIDKSKVNNIDTYKNSIEISKSDGNHIFSIEFYNEFYKTKTKKISRNDFDISYRFYLTESTSFFMKGKTLLNLLNINDNAGNLQTSSINGINITTINNNSFGYLMAGIQFKL